MKIIRVKAKDSKNITEQQAEDRFYKPYKELQKVSKTNIQKMYDVVYDLQDTIISKKQELDKKSEKLTKRGSGSLIPTDYENYPELGNLKKEIDKLSELQKHFDFMLKNLPTELMAKYGIMG